MAIADILKKISGKEEADASVYAPVAGKVIKLSDIQDEAFSSGAMGEGIAIEPSEGKVYAPCDGEITAFFPTGHAVGITAKTGAEILIHVGMDTVSLDGKGFTAKARSGEKVKKGQLLLEFDMEYIKSQNLPLTTPVVITNSDDMAELKTADVETVSNADVIMECK